MTRPRRGAGWHGWPRCGRARARGRIWKHATLADIDGICTRDEIEALFTFTLVRNPWDRMVSYYTWARAQRFEHPAVRLARCVDFTTFLAAPEIRAAWASQPADVERLASLSAEDIARFGCAF